VVNVVMVEFPALTLMLLLPALGVVFNLFLGGHAGRALVNMVSVAVVAAAFLVGLWAFYELLTLPAGSALKTTLWSWIYVGRLKIDLGLRFDALAAVMTLVVSGVGSLIHLYSCGYMGKDSDYARFFAYMNLFTLSMLVLVLADNMLFMFIGWEGVGFCSYVLIAFWYDNAQFAYNGRKAFVVNRIGDAGFLLGIFALVASFASQGVWTLDFATMREHVGGVSPVVATVAALLLFLGATGKSAQIPLYVWLPDAMVGPTPVSALIHAATMVTAGVYMVARLGFLYQTTPAAMEAVAAIGGLTAFFAATVALAQSDIKRVLAYSTISQIGYMFLGAGVGAFGAAVFHITTHAFFKALLFLGAGSVMHALGGEQEMSRMGGLRRKLPVTHATMLVATLAITAIPGFSGFFSKDQILEAAYVSGHYWLWALAVFTAGLTGLYMFRLFFLTFYGTSRVEASRLPGLHESPAVMTVPLVILALLSLAGGWIGLPAGLLWGDRIGEFLRPIVGQAKAAPGAQALMLSAIASIAAVIGLALALVFYVAAPGLPALIAARFAALYRILRDKYYVDELYDLFVTRPLFFLADFALGRVVDSYAIEGLVDGVGAAARTGAGAVRRVETGNVQHYALTYLCGALAVLAYCLYYSIRHG
jgi:NADH-quinone oxidoreductase subunit L